jgi:plastocyanin
MAKRTLLVLAAALALATPAQAATKLIGTVGTNDNFVISLKTTSGKLVTKLRAGTYTIVVRDRSGIHNFHLRGPRLDKVVTGIPFMGTKTIRVKLRPGKYTYLCDAHPTTMRGTFRVT